RNGAQISVNSQGSGQGGDIELISEHLTLENRSGITAVTASADGGNINLTVPGLLILRDGSVIATAAGLAGGNGNGGDITIDAGFLIGFNNSDIIANAFEGNGGNISITADGVYGFFARNVSDPLGDPRSNITASSQSGISGTTTINTELDASRGLDSLPTDLTDASTLISDACSVTDPEQQSAFVVIGRGGLPPTPAEVTQGELSGLEDFGTFPQTLPHDRSERSSQSTTGSSVPVDALDQSQQQVVHPLNPEPQVSAKPLPSQPVLPIQEANRVHRTETGEILLMADLPSLPLSHFDRLKRDCH
ncbi:MAG: S-layer family protein, partial [Cyanobacteria bacterium P01_H01_bin.121]